MRTHLFLLWTSSIGSHFCSLTHRLNGSESSTTPLALQMYSHWCQSVTITFTQSVHLQDLLSFLQLKEEMENFHSHSNFNSSTFNTRTYNLVITMITQYSRGKAQGCIASSCFSDDWRLCLVPITLTQTLANTPHCHLLLSHSVGEATDRRQKVHELIKHTASCLGLS